MIQKQTSRTDDSPLACKSNRFRSRSLKAAALGLGATGVADTASASIIYDLAVNSSTGATFSIDGDPLGEVRVTSNMMGANLLLRAPNLGMSTSTVELSVFQGGNMGNVDYLTLFNAGDTVDGTLSFSNVGYLVESSVENPTWPSGTTAYAGFQFDLGGGPLYGWMEVEFDITGTDFTVLGYGYDDSGGSIAAAAIPEPSTALLLGLGLVGLGAYVRKRKRSMLIEAVS